MPDSQAFLRQRILERLDQSTGLTEPPPPAVTDLPESVWDVVQQVPIEADKHPLDFARHRYLVPVYQAARFDQGTRRDLVLMTGAQVGKSVWAMLTLIRVALKFWGEKVGYFLPDREMADIFSSDRFAPMIRSNTFLAALTGASRTGLKAEDRKRVRTLGASTIFFSYMGGKTSTEAIPMRGIFFDEVRRMTMTDIERAEERTSHADYPITVKVSTAGYPDSDIHHYFLRSTQHVWQTRCRCRGGVALAEHWPECVAERKGVLGYRCPRCDQRIADPQDGQYRPRQPESPVIGFQIPQLLSPVMPVARLWEKWLRATDRQEFYNSSLGLPWLDPQSILVPEPVALACVDETLRWQASGTNCLMGVDQRGGENHVVIAAIGRGGRLELRHLALIQSDDPFAPLGDLMRRYDVDCCVMDALPNANEAIRFAKRFPRRVFLAYYSDHLHMVRWGDRDHELQALARTKADAKFEFHVMLDRYKALEWALMQWVLRHVACPHPDALVQQVRVKGMDRQSHLCRGNPETHEEGLFYHLRSVARRQLPIQRRDTTTGEVIETGEFRMVWENIGIDPHFLHAFTYCAVAAQRRTTTTQLWMAEETSTTSTVEALLARQPDLTPAAAADLVQIQQRLGVAPLQTVSPGTCSACAHFEAESRRCTARRFDTGPTYPACEEFNEVRR